MSKHITAIKGVYLGHMYAKERQDKILEYLSSHKSASVEDLALLLFVSHATIRRDLTIMERDGVLKRSHGGAVLYGGGSEETSSVIREQENIREKKIIARLACDFVTNSSTLFIDSSSTAGMVVPLLSSFRYLTVITNGLKNALLLSRLETVHTYIAGGAIHPQSNSAVGSDTCEFFSALNADLVLFSCSGVSPGSGITDASFEQSKIKRAMLVNAKIRVLLCDHHKFGQVFLCNTCDFSKLDYVITDKKPTDEFITAAANSECEILYPTDMTYYDKE